MLQMFSNQHCQPVSKIALGTVPPKPFFRS
jgi:hypothetical protein